MSKNHAISGSERLSRRALLLRLALLLSILVLLLTPNFAATTANAATPGAQASSNTWLSDGDDPSVIELDVVVPERTQQPSVQPSPVPGPEDVNALPGTGADLTYLWILAVIASVAAIAGAFFWGKSRRRGASEVR